MAEAFAEMLAGGHPNSLGRTEEAVAIVLGDRDRLEELLGSVSDDDVLVRMRAADAVEKVCRERPEWLLPHAGRLLRVAEVSEQHSVQWNTAQTLDHLRPELSAGQARRATRLLKRYLAESDDWIVLNTTMKVLVRWAAEDPSLAAWLPPHLERLSHDPRKSVAKRAAKSLAELER